MDSCLFCKIIKGEIPSRSVYKDDNLVAFYDINPKAPVHVLIVPVKHLQSLKEVEEKDKDLLGDLLLAVKNIAEKLGISQGYKVVINNGPLSGQIIFHLHLHLLGGWEDKADWNV
jgi:histidine triad (HIT) family protein